MKENYLIKEFGTRLRLQFLDGINFRKKFFSYFSVLAGMFVDLRMR